MPSRIEVRLTSATFDDFVLNEQHSLTALALGLIGNMQDAQDIVQDVLIAASRRWVALGEYDSPTAWARRAVMNRSTSVIRRRFAEARRLSLMRSRASDHLDTMPDDSRYLWEAVRGLPPRQAQAVALRSVYGLSIQEIATTMRVTKATAQVHLGRALGALRKELGDE